MLDLEALKKAVGDLEEDRVTEILEEFVSQNPSKEDAQKAVNACQEGMAIVGDLFEQNEYFVGDLIFAGELLQGAVKILKPVMGEDTSSKIGTMVLGTVKGDLHDIGKNIFKAMVEAAGFDVHDVGIDQPVNAFVEKVKEVKPDVVGMSGVLTLAIEEMKNTVDGLKEEGLRDNLKVIIGGNAVTEDNCKFVGADAHTINAAEGVKICKGWVN